VRKGSHSSIIGQNGGQSRSLTNPYEH
jgi:hypothetical protein